MPPPPNLVFPTAGCNPKLDFLDGLKAVAERAKLDKENFRLHKFRATFATWSLWAGVDLRTVQQLLGHSDMESTMRYLKPSRSQHVRDKVNKIFAWEFASSTSHSPALTHNSKLFVENKQTLSE